MRSRVRLLALATAVLTALFAVGAFAARAQVPLPTDTTTTTTPQGTTTTTAGSGPPTTRPPLPTGTTTTTAPAKSTTTTTAPPAPGTPGPGGTTTTPPPDPNAPPDSGPDTTPTGPIAIPPQYAALMNSIHRSPANGTQKLLDALAPLEDLGIGANDAIAQSFGHFPVAGPTTFTDDWWYPRNNIPFHLHQGTDIFAAMGTPVRAPDDGIVKHTDGGLGGLAAYVYTPSGTYYYMAHLSSVPPNQPDGTPVHTGDLVGYVGNTGDAAGGPTHCHFEIHMDPAKNPYLMTPPTPPTRTTVKDKRGRTKTVTVPGKPGHVDIPGDIHDPVLYGRGTEPATDPKPFLDKWLADDLAGVPTLIARLQANKPRAILDTGLLRRFSDGGGLFAAPVGPPRPQLLWASSASPSGGSLQLAEAEATAAADQLDWAALARREQARQVEYAADRRWADELLDPLTPAALRRLTSLPAASTQKG